MITIDTTWLTIAMVAFALYYVGLFVLVRLRRVLRLGAAREDVDISSFAVVFVVPAHNEELVISRTIDSLLALRGPVRPLVLVMNDGSHDATSDVAKQYEATGSVYVVDRPADVAGRGKGDVLNHGLRVIDHLLAVGHPRLAGRIADDVIVGVVDADGMLEHNALEAVLPLFADGEVGGVQVGVAIRNAPTGLLPRLQDMEFVGFSGYVQEARDGLGSVGLGGNGQFTRLSALLMLPHEPWTSCLTEDLDLGLSLAEDGWRIRFCGDTAVLQQGLTRLRPLLRQRTRWFQGHYQCWSHLASLHRSPLVSTRSKIDLTLYLVLVLFVLVITGGAVIGVVDARNGLVTAVPDAVVTRTVTLALSVAPVAGFMWTYQRRSAHPLRVWEIPAYSLAFVLFTYLLAVAQLRAWGRMIAGRGNWAKTARVVEVPA